MKYIKLMKEYFDNDEIKNKYSDFNIQNTITKSKNNPYEISDVEEERSTKYYRLDMLIDKIIPLIKNFKLNDRFEKSDENKFKKEFIFKKSFKNIGELKIEFHMFFINGKYILDFHPSVNSEYLNEQMFQFKYHIIITTLSELKLSLKEINNKLNKFIIYIENEWGVEVF